jgi:S1-C subfamily serine protease
MSKSLLISVIFSPIIALLSHAALAEYGDFDITTLGAPTKIGGSPLDKVAQAPLVMSSSFKDVGSDLELNMVHDRLTAASNQSVPVTRGAKEAQIYSRISPSVVMVVTNDGIGSGAVINKAGEIITNWHVIEGYDKVGVVFKPEQEGRRPTKADLHKAWVVRFDEVADLAILRLVQPPLGINPIRIGSVSSVPVGSDVHAIGHPTGESWTYTRGFVSQVRKDYEWVTESQKKHKADVIQTQTPINPGNSGGPLLNESGELVGINSFIAQGEGLNFAVSIDEVNRILSSETSRYAASARPQRTPAPTPADCEGRELESFRNDQKRANITLVDLDCDGSADGFVTIPDNPNEPVTLSVDTNADGNIDVAYVDLDRDGQVDISGYDTNGDGEPDLLGYHRNGEAEPYRFEPMPG